MFRIHIEEQNLSGITTGYVTIAARWVCLSDILRFCQPCFCVFLSQVLARIAFEVLGTWVDNVVVQNSYGDSSEILLRQAKLTLEKFSQSPKVWYLFCK